MYTSQNTMEEKEEGCDDSQDTDSITLNHFELL